MIELYTIPGCVWPRRQTALPIDLSHQQFQRMQLSDRALFHILPAEISGSASVCSCGGFVWDRRTKEAALTIQNVSFVASFWFLFFLQTSCMSTNIQRNYAEQVNKCVTAQHGCNFKMAPLSFPANVIEVHSEIRFTVCSKSAAQNSSRDAVYKVLKTRTKKV